MAVTDSEIDADSDSYAKAGCNAHAETEDNS
jgi:hypothetical protein